MSLLNASLELHHHCLRGMIKPGFKTGVAGSFYEGHCCCSNPPKDGGFDEIGEGGNRRARLLNGVERASRLISYEQQTQVTPFPVLLLYLQLCRSLPLPFSLFFSLSFPLCFPLSRQPSQLWSSCPTRPSACQPAFWTESHYTQS